MAGSVQESDIAVAHFGTIGADMLGDPARFGRSDIGVADPVQQRGFTVVNVAHNYNNRASFLQIGGIVVFIVNELFFNGDAVSYTHLDVYKRQPRGRSPK